MIIRSLNSVNFATLPGLRVQYGLRGLFGSRGRSGSGERQRLVAPWCWLVVLLMAAGTSVGRCAAADGTAGAGLAAGLSTSLTDGMTAEQQRQAIEEFLGDLEPQRFFRPSVVSPFVFQLRSLGRLDDGGQRQRLDVWFAAQGTLDQVADKQLLERLSGRDAAAETAEAADDGLPQQSRPLTDAELAARSLTNGPLTGAADRDTDADSLGADQVEAEQAYGLLAVNLLDKAYVSGITQTRLRRSDQSLEVRLRWAPETLGDDEFPVQWQPLSKSADGQIQLGPAAAYDDLHAVIRVSQLVDRPGSLLIEAHVEYSEPHGWFEGRNLLRSKLPPVLQDAVRQFRRQLAAQ